MEPMYCQSCAMPLVAETDFGTNRDGSKNKEYCAFCFKDGQFTQNVTMEEMIQICLQYSDSFKHENGESYTKEEALAGMLYYFPQLKRWKKE